MAFYNPDLKNTLEVRANKIYADGGAYVWDSSKNDWASLAESNQVYQYAYLKENSIEMTDVDMKNTLSSESLTFTAGLTSSTLSSNQIEFDDGENSTTTNSQGVTVDGLNNNKTIVSPASLYVENNASQNIEINPVGVSITGADSTNVDLQSSFIKIKNASGTTVSNLSQTGLFLSNGSSSSTNLTSAGVTTGDVNCSTLDMSYGTSSLSADRSTFTLGNTVDSSTCQIQSSNIQISNKNKNCSLSLDGNSLTGNDINKLHNLSTDPYNPTCYVDTNVYNLNPIALPGSTNADTSRYCYNAPGYTNFTAGDSIQLWVTGTLQSGVSQYCYLRIYLPFNNEFIIQAMRTEGDFQNQTGVDSIDANNLLYPLVSYRRSNFNKASTQNIFWPTDNSSLVMTPYIIMFNCNGIDKATMTFNYCINISCISSVNAYNSGVKNNHK